MINFRRLWERASTLTCNKNGNANENDKEAVNSLSSLQERPSELTSTISWPSSNLVKSNSDHQHLSTLFEADESHNINGYGSSLAGGEIIENTRMQNGQCRRRSLEDYQLLKVIGKGCMGKVLLARDKSSSKIYAIKSISKKWVVSHGVQEIEHIMGEQRILAALSQIKHPFLIRLHCSFQNPQNLFLILEYVSGGDLATQLEIYGKFCLDRAKFYCAEMISGILELHRLGIIYRDLKPENVLISSDGHIKLTDFGLSKQFKISTKLSHDENLCMGSRDCACLKTKTFCGTAEYLAPEVLLEQPYSFEVDWWSLGTFLYEMIVGITPFWAENHSVMYQRVLRDSLDFPPDFPSELGKDFITKLLERNPSKRLGHGDVSGVQICSHPFLSDINWNDLYVKKVPAPYIPQLRGEIDVRWFDKSFTRLPPKISPVPFSPESNAPVADTVMFNEHFQGYTYLSTSAQVMMQSFSQNRNNNSAAVIEARYAKRRRLREMKTDTPEYSLMSPIEACILEEDGLEFNFEDL